jgi:diacylglycerol kinase (ATP)
VNGERFAVMAGVGFDAQMIHDAKPKLKRSLGRTAYVLAAAKNLRGEPFEARVDVDGERWFAGTAQCVLFGNVGDAFAGLTAFENARPDDGLLEVGVASPNGILQWGRTLARSALANASESPFVQTTKGRLIDVRLDRKVMHELDGSERKKQRKFTVDVHPRAITVCVPA